jgi:membrane protein implicated in regulation of membrane protease activity
MENLTANIQPFTPIVLSSVGILLIAIEAIITSFVVIWIGLALIIVAGITIIYPYNDGYYQISSVAIMSIILLLLLRTKLKDKFMNSKEGEIEDNFLKAGGKGRIKNNQVYFKGTYWKYDSKSRDTYIEDEEVTVIQTENSTAFIKKICNEEVYDKKENVK